MTVLTPTPLQKFWTNNGAPAARFKLFTYSAGTDIKLVTYKNSAGIAENTNPIVLDFRGECNLWIPPNVAYKYVFAPANDTDPPANPIWSVDNIVNDQLVTLWGGVDTGIANAYVLNFVSNFTTYADGIVIYWIPSNTNTGASTINVNGLGPVPITNQDGSPLYLGQLQANQVALIIYKGTGFVLVAFGLIPKINTQDANYILQIEDANNIVLHTSVLAHTWTVPANATVGFPIGTEVEFINSGSGTVSLAAAGGVTLTPYAGTTLPIILASNCSTTLRKIATNTWQQTTTSNLDIRGLFTGTVTGMVAATTGQIDYLKTNSLVALSRSGGGTNLTGTSNSNSMTLTGLPATLWPKFTTQALCFALIDNGVLVAGTASVSAAGVVSFLIVANPPVAFTAAGTKGLSAGWTLVYPLL